MPARDIAIALLLLTSSWPLAAQDIDLSTRIAPGKWALHYQRTGEFKPLRLKQNDHGISYACMDDNPRKQILGWINGIGCAVDHESLVGEVYQLQGQCRLKWWKSRPIPVRVELRPEHGKAFSMTIRTEGDSLLGFVEQTIATHQGDCDNKTVSAAK